MRKLVLENWDDTMAWLKVHGEEVGADNSTEALAIKQAYSLFYRKPENAALGLLMGAIEAYAEVKEVNE